MSARAVSSVPLRQQSVLDKQGMISRQKRAICVHTHCTHTAGGVHGASWRKHSRSARRSKDRAHRGAFFARLRGRLADAAPARTARHTAAPVLVHVVKVLLAVLDLQEGGGGGATGRCGCKGRGGKSAWRQGGKARCAPCARALVRHRGRDGGRIAPGRGAWRAAGLGGGGEQAHRLPGSPKKTTGAHQG